MLTLWTTETEPKKFHSSELKKTSEQGAEKSFSVNRSKRSSRRVSKFSTMDAANFQQKFRHSVLLVTYGQNLTIEPKMSQIRQ